MTNEQIIMMIVIAVISSFAKVIFEKILAPYIPDRKKLTSYIRNFFRLMFMYALPIAAIILLMTGPYVLSKYSVFGIAFNFFALSINLGNYIWTLTNKNFLNQLEVLKKLIDISEIQTERISTIEEFLKLKKPKK